MMGSIQRIDKYGGECGHMGSQTISNALRNTSTEGAGTQWVNRIAPRPKITEHELIFEIE
jgi:hypothetical protein